ncbi:hypothetical protein [Thermococcus sp. 21S7]|uniref:hypothetical protein n=1 Tax=Thermococcus sp. 21S7 TaxID=1638221 RepID=UPI00143C54AE|nr:hypothetical protein [Thermococcus sp. 21S7]NJE61895.1 hypothetical protein [Thermococcus sp. 21S7]
MRRIASLLLVSMILGMVLSGAVSLGTVSAASAQKEGDVYTQFWEILYREAYLADVLNKSINSGRINVTAAKELIGNSRSGEENAAEISARIWLALQELKKSGVKLQYSPEELRQMAEEIKKNGFPADTVNELKSQGWTDEEIRALEEYIVRNADNITTGFDMESFLENLSTALVGVGFKYAGYETWALEKWKWSHPEETKEQALESYGGYPREIVPGISRDWVSFYTAYLKDNVSGMKLSLEDIIELMEDTLMPLLYSSGTTFVSDGGVMVQNVHRVGNSLLGYSYYWPSALKAYNLTRQVYVLVEAMSMGNTNPELNGILNQKVAELKDALVVYYHDETSINPNPNPNPPHPCIGRRCLLSGTSSKLSGSLNASNRNFNNGGDLLKKFALDVDSNYGYIKITSVDVIVDHVMSTEATYHVSVTFTAVKNFVSDINLKLRDSNGLDSYYLNVLYPGDSYTWDSEQFTVNFDGADSAVVRGNVVITYKSHPTPPPKSPEEVPSLNGKIREMTVSASYSKTIKAKKADIDPAKVAFSIEPSDTSIEEGSSVIFRVSITNRNSKPVTGKWTFNAGVPDDEGNPILNSERGVVTVPAGGTSTFEVAAFNYIKPGTYAYWGAFTFGPNGIYKNRDSGRIVVHRTPQPPPTPSKGSIKIVGIVPKPDPPKDGEAVEFSVMVKNSYSTGQNIELKLFVDGNLVDTSDGVIEGNSKKPFTLTWTARGSEHSYTVKVYRLVDGRESIEDSWNGDLNVVSSSRSFAVRLKASPVELDGGGTVYFTVKAWNFDSSRLCLRGFVKDDEGAVVKTIDRCIPAKAQNYTVTAFSLVVHGVGNHTYRLFLDNYDGKPNGKGDEHWDEVRVGVKSFKVQKASMDCSNMVLSAKKGNLVLDMTCEVYFTNPTDVSWKVTDVVTEARILKSQHTQEITPEFSDALLTPTVPAKGTGRLQVNFHDTLSASGFLGKSVKIGDLAGVSVPVEVDLTLEVNGKTYVVDSQGNIWSLKYRAIKMVEISIEGNKIAMDLSSELAIVAATTAVGAVIGGLVGGPVGAVVGAVAGAVTGIILSYILHERLGIP